MHLLGEISSFGSIISVVATWVFLQILYVQLLEGKSVSRYPWVSPQFYADFLQCLLNRAYSSLEWCLNSPPKPHALASLPLQSVLIFTYHSQSLIIPFKSYVLMYDTVLYKSTLL